MSMMGELTIFLGLQVHQRNDGIFIMQAKYMRDFLNRFDLVEYSHAKTPISTIVKLDAGDKGIYVNITIYRGMVGSLFVRSQIIIEGRVEYDMGRFIFFSLLIKWIVFLR